MKSFVSVFFLLISFIGISQNLILNPSFEDNYSCPTQLSQLNSCKYLFNPLCGNSQTVCNWAPDYFNTCANISSNVNVPNTFNGQSYRDAKDGNAFVGIMNTINNYQGGSVGQREYIQMKLTTPLIAGKKYDFSFYAGSRKFTTQYNIETDQIGIHFVNDSIIYPNMKLWEFMNADWVSNEYITDSVGWQKLSGNYVANGGEKWLIIGIFTSNGNDDFPHKLINGISTNFKGVYTYFDDFHMEEHIEQPPTPTITTTPPTCTAMGSATITNYDTSNTYVFSPIGPTVDNNGVISSMVAGTSYTVIANDGSTNSEPSEVFSIAEQLPTPSAPMVTSPQAFCNSAVVAGLIPSTANYSWYAVANGGTPLNSSDILSSGTYYISQTIDGCESERATVEVVINPIPTIIISSDTTICKGETVLLTVSGADSYVWSPTNENGSSISVSPNVTTTYTVTGTTNGCSNTATVKVTVVNKPTASFTANPETGFVPLSVNFTNTSTSANNYAWFVDSVYQTPTNNFTDTFENEGSYVITLIANNGVCPADTAYKTIVAVLPVIVKIPNVFTPNNDGENDLWTIDGKIKTVLILNRWGNVVFSSSNDFTAWDGTNQQGQPCVSGTYFYKIEDEELNVHVGFLTLLR